MERRRARDQAGGGGTLQSHSAGAAVRLSLRVPTPTHHSTMSILCGRYSRPWWRGFDVDFGIAGDAVAFWHSVGAAYAGCLPPSSQRTAGRGEGGHSHNDSTQKQNKKQEKNKKKNSVKGDQGRPTSGNVRRVGTSPVCSQETVCGSHQHLPADAPRRAATACSPPRVKIWMSQRAAAAGPQP
ncbi:hypothetical protein AcW2_007004 [Taiwanofungus camphoratus]|nr:hypothetical protein AcW2_007004 [Antrodia cinnamomea]